jgi:hypothetical protein
MPIGRSCPRYKSIVNWDIHQVFHPAIWSVRPGDVGVQFFGELPLLGNRYDFRPRSPAQGIYIHDSDGAPLHSQRTCSSYNGSLFFIALNRASFTRFKWNEAVDAPFLAPLLSRRKTFDCLEEIIVADGYLGGPVAAKLLGESLQKISRF